MLISSLDLKSALKRLSPIKTDVFRFDGGTISAQDSDAIVVAQGPRFAEPFTVNGKKLSATVNRLGKEIDISQSEKSLVLKSAKARVELEIQKVKSVSLPLFPETKVTFDLLDFKKALALASASASPQKSQRYGGCVQLQNLPLMIEDLRVPGYRIVGTDSVVLTIANVLQPIPFEMEGLLNLTAASVIQLMDGEKIEIGESDTHLQLRSGTTTVYASKPVQAYPNFGVLLAKQPTVKIKFNPQEWLSALRTVEPLIDEGKDKGAVSLRFREGVVQWEIIGVGDAASDESVYEQLDPDPIFETRDFDLKLTAKHLSGFLSKAGPEATLGVTDGPVRLESGDLVVLAMPIRGSK